MYSTQEKLCVCEKASARAAARFRARREIPDGEPPVEMPPIKDPMPKPPPDDIPVTTDPVSPPSPPEIPKPDEPPPPPPAEAS